MHRQVTNQLGIWIPQDVRDPKRFHIPASFWSGTCEVHVACRFPNVSKPRFPPGANFASFQQNTIWPNARRMARRIVDKCFPTSKTGFDEGSGTIAFEAITPLQSRMECDVFVEGHRPRPLDPADPRVTASQHYYQTDASGKVVRVSGRDIGSVGGWT